MTDGPKKPKRRDPLLEAADALDAGRLTHDMLLAMNTPERVAAGYAQDTDLGTLAAAGLGAARGASFGLGDLAQKLLLNPTEKAAVATTTGQHPYATTGGTIAGAALPFLLAPGLTGEQIAPRAAIGIGAAQGAGLTPGGPVQRALGAGLGAATAFAAPYALRGLGAMAGKLPLVGNVIRRAQGVQTGFPTALKAAATDGTPEEIAVAQKLGLTVDQVRGRVGAAAIKAAAKAPPAPPAVPIDPMETPTFLRNAAPPSPGPSGSVANSYQELRQLLNQGVAPSDVRINYYPRGGLLQRAVPPGAAAPAAPGMNPVSLQQLQLLVKLPTDQFEAAATMFPAAVMDQLRALRGGLLTPALP
jgi:hypothetical protein